MQICAKLKYVRIAPRKVRLLADLVRGKNALSAQTILSFTGNKSAGVILKLLNQAIDNAKNNFKISEEGLYIAKLTVDGGPILKRFRPRARGSANEIQKKTSHITLILEGGGQKVEKTEKVQKEEPKKEEPKKGESIETKSQSKIKAMSEKETVKPNVQKLPTKIFRRQTF
jgi:large subunit ribosomal protein L22